VAFRQSIFEPFKQVQGSAAHKKGGTGLGLAISQAIVAGHDGVIGVEDAPGGGARFWFEVPL
jgi:signal transduction histidine kinase